MPVLFSVWVINNTCEVLQGVVQQKPGIFFPLEKKFPGISSIFIVGNGGKKPSVSHTCRNFQDE